MTLDCDILLNECRNRQSVISKGGSVHEPDECFLPKCHYKMTKHKPPCILHAPSPQYFIKVLMHF